MNFNKSVIYNLYRNEHNELIDSIYSSLLDELYNIEKYSIDELKKNIDEITKNYNNKKTRWYKDYLKDKDGKYLKGLELANANLSIFNERNYSEDKIKEGFRLIFLVDSIEELEKNLNLEVLAWKNDENSSFAEFDKFKKLSGKKLRNAIKYDITFNYIHALKVKYNNELQEITRIPSFIAAIGIDTTNKIIGEIADKSKSGTKYLTTLEESDELLVSLKYDLEKRLEGQQSVEDVMTKIALVKAMKDFTNLDVAIINYFYTDLYNVVNENTELISIRSIVQKLNLPPNGANLERVKNSLLKIGSINMNANYFTSDSRVSLAGGILEVYLKDNEVGVTLGRFLRQLAIMNSTFNFNTDVYNKLSKDSQQIAIWLQKRRLRRVTEGDFAEDMISMYQIARSIKSQTSNSTLLKRRIEKVLNELIDNYLIVSRFRKDKGSMYYYINYVRLPEDIEKKIMSKEMQSSELIEGADFKTVELV